jgi:hypothetical protein
MGWALAYCPRVSGGAAGIGEAGGASPIQAAVKGPLLAFPDRRVADRISCVSGHKARTN